MAAVKTWAPGDPLPGDETPAFLERSGEQLYVVHHAAAGERRASVVLAGPMTLERSHGYLTWVRLARLLAVNGYDAWRFDYRGVGESTGDFRQQTFDAWHDDLGAVVAHIRAQGSGRVVVLGLRLGALLALRIFEGGRADGLLAWDPPAGGKPMLMEMLRRKLAADYMEFSGGERKSRDDYVRELERGDFVEVEGYHWSRGLWRSAEPWTFATPRGGDFFVTLLDGRPPERMPEGPHHASVKIPKPAFWLQSAHLIPELGGLFKLTIERLDEWSRAWATASAERAS